ncbi:MAG: TolB family protein [Planctomycetaceae bacterium]
MPCRRAKWIRLPLLAIMALFAPIISRAEEESIPAGWRRITTDGLFKQRPQWSLDGERLLFTRHGEDSIHLFQCRADGTDDKRLLTGEPFNFDAVISPDAKRLAYVFDKLTPGQGDMQIYVASADGENPQPLFVSEGKLSHEEWPNWSPDGKWIVCHSTRDENAELYLLSVGVNEKGEPTNDIAPKRLTSDPALDVHPCFSPDGRQIAFATNRWGDFELATFDLESASVTRLSTSPGLDDYPAWSPDGKQLAFTSHREGNLEIFIANADGSNPRNLTQHAGPDNFATWSPEGEITWVSFHNGQWDIFSVKP